MKRVTIVAKNRPGIIADISAVLAEANVNIESIDGQKVRGWAVLKLHADQDLALDALGSKGIAALSDDTLLLRLNDRPGSLARVSARFKEANIDLRAVRIVDRDDTECLVAVSTEDVEAARALVKDVLL